MYSSSSFSHPPRDVWRCASSICVAIRVCKNCESVAAHDNRFGLAGVVASEGGDIFNLLHKIWKRFFGMIEPNSGLLNREVFLGDGSGRSLLEKQRVEARAVMTGAVFDLSWLPAVSAVVYGDGESATKLHLGRVGVDVLWKISGRKIDGQDEMKMSWVIE